MELLSNKQSVEEISVQRAVKTTFRVLFDENFYDGSPNVEAVLNDFLFVERHKPDLEAVNDVIQ